MFYYIRFNSSKFYYLFLKSSNNYAAAVFDINNDGYSEILVTHNNSNSTEITLYYYHFDENKWKYKKKLWTKKLLDGK